jgi:hypothetical protein
VLSSSRLQYYFAGTYFNWHTKWKPLVLLLRCALETQRRRTPQSIGKAPNESNRIEFELDSNPIRKLRTPYEFDSQRIWGKFDSIRKDCEYLYTLLKSI